MFLGTTVTKCISSALDVGLHLTEGRFYAVAQDIRCVYKHLTLFYDKIKS